MSTGSAQSAVREELAAGDVTGPRDLADRLASRGVELDPDDVRAALRSLGAIRVEGPDGPVLAIPVNRDAAAATGGQRPPATRLGASIAADADWPIQIAVAAVVALLLLVAFIGWLIAP